MPLIERIYDPTQKDLLSGLRQQRFSLQLSASSASAIVNADSSAVPPDTARFITGLSWNATPGAAQTIELFQAFVLLAGAASVSMQFNQSAPYRVAAVLVGCYIPVDFVMLPGEVLRMQAQFNAGAAANALNAFAVGFDIPRANIV